MSHRITGSVDLKIYIFLVDGPPWELKHILPTGSTAMCQNLISIHGT